MNKQYRSGLTAVVTAAVLLVIGSAASCQVSSRLGGPLAVFYRFGAPSLLDTWNGVVNPALTAANYNTQYGYGAYNPNGYGQGVALPRQGPGSITMSLVGDDELEVQWIGNTSYVQRIYIALFDSRDNLINQSTISSLPVVADFTLTPDASYVGVEVDYVDGTASRSFRSIQ